VNAILAQNILSVCLKCVIKRVTSRAFRALMTLLQISIIFNVKGSAGEG